MENKTKKKVDGSSCPQCGGTLVANPAADKRTMIKSMVDAGATAPYATNFAESHHEKEATDGVVHVCGNCRYVTRVKAAA